MPASRLSSAFTARAGATGLIPFLTAGYPSLEGSLELMHALERSGALALEIGVPFSDPIADGPDIQRASEWSLARGTGVFDVLDLIAQFRTESSLPVVVMTYLNPVERVGAVQFAQRAAAAGVDGVLLSDLPPEELPATWAAMDAAALDTVLLVAPTTTSARLPRLLQRCRGFVYCLSRTGVTGRAEGYAGLLAERLAEVRSASTLPIAVGFGIASAADARALSGQVDAAIVGAAFMRLVHEDPARGATQRVSALAGQLVAALA